MYSCRGFILNKDWNDSFHSEKLVKDMPTRIVLSDKKKLKKLMS